MTQKTRLHINVNQATYLAVASFTNKTIKHSELFFGQGNKVYETSISLGGSWQVAEI